MFENLFSFVNLIGYLGFASIFVSFFFDSRQKILIFQTLGSLFFMLHIGLRGDLSAASFLLLVVTRNVLFTFFKDQKLLDRVLWFWLLLFVLILIFTWSDWLSLMPFLSSVLATFAAWVKDTRKMRILYLVSAFPWLVYGGVIESLPTMAIQLTYLVSTGVNIIRFDFLKKQDV